MRNTHWPLVVAISLVLTAATLCGCKKSPTSKQEEAATQEPARQQEVPQPETDRGRLTVQIFQAYQKDVVGSLKAALVGGGTTAAIPVCKGVSAKLSERFATMEEVSVRRVAVRYRNAEHIPDAFEASIFKEWEEGLENGLPPVAISRETEEGLRVMQPIMLGARLCLRCHGKQRDMAPETIAMLKRLYPQDNAIDFELGDVRGAFSAVWRNGAASAPAQGAAE